MLFPTMLYGSIDILLVSAELDVVDSRLFENEADVSVTFLTVQIPRGASEVLGDQYFYVVFFFDFSEFL